MPGDPLQPVLGGTLPFDATAQEVESRAEFDARMAVRSLAGLVVLGLRLDLDPPDFAGVDVRDALFVGCRLASAEVEIDLIRRGAHLVPPFDARPFPTHPAVLYTPEDLSSGFDQGGFAGMYDRRVYEHFLAHGGATPDIREALAQRLHDAGIDNALGKALAAWVATHGTEGAAIDMLEPASDFLDHDPYTAAALAVRRAYPAPRAAVGDVVARLTLGGLALPTWLYGHEPANLFAGQIGKYFSNAVREDSILRLSRGGIVFAPGWAGTVQEVFQAATKTFYQTDGPSGAFVFLGAAHWSALGVEALLRPLLARSPHGDQSALIVMTDSLDEAMAALTTGR